MPPENYIIIDVIYGNGGAEITRGNVRTAGAYKRGAIVEAQALSPRARPLKRNANLKRRLGRSCGFMRKNRIVRYVRLFFRSNAP